MNMERPLNILFLVGVKHSGKSSLGRAACRILARSQIAHFYDVDELIVAALPPPYTTIREFYRLEGQSAFMELEMKALQCALETLPQGLVVFALGGGACDNLPLVELMQSTGKIIYLAVEEATLLKRIIRGSLPPFLDKDDPESSFRTLYRQRDAQYRQLSDYVLQLYDCRSIEENGEIVASAILEVTGSEEKCRKIVLEQPLE